MSIFVNRPVESSGAVKCTLCTHTVPAVVVTVAKRSRTKPGQKCPRCGASLDAAGVQRLLSAA
jgi:hypothetical protein